MKSGSDKKLEKICAIIGVCITSILLLVLIYRTYKLYATGEFAMESALKKAAGDGEQFCMSDMINGSRAVGLINYGCTPVNRITQGIKKCNGKYYIFADKVNGTWVVDSASKHVIW